MPLYDPRKSRIANHHRTGILSEDYPADPYRNDLDKVFDPYDTYGRMRNGTPAPPGSLMAKGEFVGLVQSHELERLKKSAAAPLMCYVFVSGRGYEVRKFKSREALRKAVTESGAVGSANEYPSYWKEMVPPIVSRRRNPSGRVANPSKADLLGSVGKMTRSYLHTAIWAETNPNTGEPLSDKYDTESFNMASIKQAKIDCDAFMEAVIAAGLGNTKVTKKGVTRTVATSPVSVGHDFWLTRCHHGAGFWDGDYEAGEELTKIAHRFAERGIFPSGKTLNIEHA
jgi:hypothetical protein